MLTSSFDLPSSGCRVSGPGSLAATGVTSLSVAPAEALPLGAWRRFGQARLDRAGEAVERGVPVVLVVGTLVVPLLFWPVEDVFELPKLLAAIAATLALLAGLALMALRSHQGRFDPATWTVTALVLYLLLVGAATLRSTDPIHSLTGEPYQYQGMIASVCSAVAFVAGRRSLATHARLRVVAAALVLAGGVAAGYGLIQEAGLDPIWQELNRGRIFSTLGQANALAAFLVLAVPVSLGLAVTSRTTGRVIAAAATVAIGTALALTMSRGGYLGAVVALAIFVALVPRRPVVTRRRLGYALAGLVALGAIAVTVPPLGGAVARVVERMQVIVNPAESSAASHLDLWAVGARIALDHPLLGVGPENYPDEFALYRDAVLPPARADAMAKFRPESPHNVPLAIADGAGIPALGAYLALIMGAMGVGLRRLRQAAARERTLLAALLAACAGHVVTDLFMTGEIAGTWTFWLLLGALAAVGQPRHVDGLDPVAWGERGVRSMSAPP